MSALRLSFLILISVLFISACGSDRAAVHSNDHVPYLSGFNLVDSSGHDSAYGGGSDLFLDPYLNGGLFEVYWHVDSFADYWVTVSVNDEPTLRGAVILSSELCGPGRACDEGGLHVCEYTSDYQMGCGIDLHEAHYNLESVSGLIDYVPETVFINLEVCDYQQFHCTIDSIPVEVF